MKKLDNIQHGTTEIRLFSRERNYESSEELRHEVASLVFGVEAVVCGVGGSSVMNMVEDERTEVYGVNMRTFRDPYSHMADPLWYSGRHYPVNVLFLYNAFNLVTQDWPGLTVPWTHGTGGTVNQALHTVVILQST